MVTKQCSLDQSFVDLGDWVHCWRNSSACGVGRASPEGIQSVRVFYHRAHVRKSGEQALCGIACRNGLGHRCAGGIFISPPPDCSIVGASLRKTYGVAVPQA
ncbi:MAG: hypothetical protein KME46_13490 [Brasilonema angustatum HA4187-MV1]|nr:hypothetical protein [Brasilonema angustatum HA4187-MV1]